MPALSSPSATASSLLVRLRDPADQDAWQRMNALYSPLLLDWCRRYDVPNADAYDLVQEVLLTVVRELPDFQYDRARGTFRGWLRTILVNRLRYYRRSSRFRGRAEYFDHLLDQLADDRSGLSQIWEQEHQQSILARLLELVRDEFEPTTWAAFLAVSVDGADPADVATRLELTPNAVRIAKCRVLRRLQQEAVFLDL
jgi:RNA polymerase sigma-70 factor (ECF subfamily)